jgi:hypothetical protein
MERNNDSKSLAPRAQMPSIRASERGSVVTYILITIFLIGLLTLSVTDGPKKSATTMQLDQMTVDLRTDLNTIESAVINCILVYPDDKSGATNPNKPFPLVGDALATTGALADAQCPGAPAGSRGIFSNKSMYKFLLLDDTATYTSTYTSDSTSVQVLIERTSASPLWTEALSRIAADSSSCKVHIEDDKLYFAIKNCATVAGPPPTCAGGVEVGGSCWYYGALGQSCTTVCSNAGKSYSAATESYAGSAGTDAQCGAVLDAIGGGGTGDADQVSDCGFNLGCYWSPPGGGGDNMRGRCTNIAATAGGSWALANRACACQ